MLLSKSILLSLVLAASEAAAAAIPKSNHTCVSFMVQVPVINATVVIPPFPEFQDESQSVAFVNQATIRTPSVPHVNLTTLTKIFNISAEYCAPTHPGPKASTLHLLSHGLGFNRSYWNLYLPGKPDDASYSYVNSATGAGYSTLAWNRLGIEPSTIADPYTEIQAGVELAVLAGLTTLVRAGNITQVPAPKKVVHIGHSFGSILTVGLAAVAPELSDGIILTGYSALSNYTGLFLAASGLRFASENQPSRFPNKTYSSGYVTWPDKYSNQYSFLEYPYYDPAMLDHAESSKFPFTVGEFITIGALPGAAPGFKSPTLYLAAEADLIFCASNCTGLFGKDSAAIQAFNGSSSVEAYVHPNAGHGINLHKNATGAYDYMLKWADRHGF